MSAVSLHFPRLRLACHLVSALWLIAKAGAQVGTVNATMFLGFTRSGESSVNVVVCPRKSLRSSTAAWALSLWIGGPALFSFMIGLSTEILAFGVPPKVLLKNSRSLWLLLFGF